MRAEELISLIKDGDMVAFRQLYELFERRVYNTGLSYLQNVQEAEEVTQDVFMEVYHHAAGYKGSASVSTWIYRIVINKCIDKVRYKSRQKRFGITFSLFSKDGSVIAQPKDFVHPGVVAENREKSARLFAAIYQLADNQRIAFILKHIENLSQKEIADVMELGEKAVESLLQRAKANLRKTLGDMYHETKD